MGVPFCPMKQNRVGDSLTFTLNRIPTIPSLYTGPPTPPHCLTRESFQRGGGVRSEPPSSLFFFMFEVFPVLETCRVVFKIRKTSNLLKKKAMRSSPRHKMFFASVTL